MTDLIDLGLDDDDVGERPVVTRRPLHPPPPPFQPLSSTVRFPPGPVAAVEDVVTEPVAPAPRLLARVRGPWTRAWLRPVPQVRAALRVRAWTRSRVVAGLLGVFLGGLGLHRLYLGYWRRGLTMLAVTVVGGFFTFGIAAVVVGLWGFTEGLVILSVRRGHFSHDARGRLLRG